LCEVCNRLVAQLLRAQQSLLQLVDSRLALGQIPALLVQCLLYSLYLVANRRDMT